VALGVVGVMVIAAVIGLLAGRETVGTAAEPTPSATGELGPLEVTSVTDLDPQGGDGTENPDETELAIDGDPSTGWTTSLYYRRADLGGLKDGVGLVLDLGSLRDVDSVRLTLGGEPTSLSILTAAPGADGSPTDVDELTEAARVDQAGADVTVSLPDLTFTRYVVVWLRELPPAGPDQFRGDIREIRVQGRS
jgi:putative peptidoglycan lipid II flippase